MTLASVRNTMGTKPFEIAYQNISSLSFHPDGAYFVTGDSSGFLRQWSAVDRVQDSLWTMKTKEQISAVAVSADGRWIISSGNRGTGSKVTIWSTVTREHVIEVEENTGAICALDISNDSTRFAVGSTDNTVRIYDIASGSRLIPPQQLRHSVVGVKFSPDASFIAITSVTNNCILCSSYLKLDNASSGNHLSEILIQETREQQTITPPAWSFDRKLIFVASPGKMMCINASSHTPRCSEWGVHRDGNDSQQVCIMTSGRFIVYSTGSSISLWDYASREQIGQIIVHAMPVNCIAISYDRRRLACGHGGGITMHNLEGFVPESYLPGILSLPLMQVSTTVIKSWVQGNPMETEAILSDEIAQRSNPTHDSLAICALIRAHLGEWRIALETTEKSLQIKPSPIGQIARSIALIGTGEQEVALNELDLVFCGCDPSDIQLLLVINSIILFMCNRRKEAISRLRRFISGSHERMKDVYCQVLGMMYLKQGDYGNAVQTLGIVKNPFTTEDHGPLMTLFIIFNWNFENLKSIARERACERMYATGSVKEVGDALLEMVKPLPEDEKERTHGHILQEIVTRSGDVTLLAWTGKSSTCNSCLPSSPAVYTQTTTTHPSLACDQEELQRRIAELSTTVPLANALMTYTSVTRAQPPRFTHFRLLLPCVIFSVRALRKEENVYYAETVGLGDIEFKTADLLPLKQPRRLLLVNPWIHHLRESNPGVPDEEGSDLEFNTRAESDTDAGRNIGLAQEPMIEEVPTPDHPSTSRSLEVDVHTRALELVARLGQPFSALLLLKQPDGAYRRVAADHEIALCGIADDALSNIRVEILEIV